MKKKGSNKIVITDSFQAWAHKWGRIGTLIALLYMIAIPFVVLTFYDSLPSIGEVINLSTISILMVYIPVGFSEAISYTPILGASSYLTFITGNIMNLKLPCAVNAMKLTKKNRIPRGAKPFLRLLLRYVRYDDYHSCACRHCLAHGSARSLNCLP